MSPRERFFRFVPVTFKIILGKGSSEKTDSKFKPISFWLVLLAMPGAAPMDHWGGGEEKRVFAISQSTPCEDLGSHQVDILVFSQYEANGC
jgi:hypothetical protein